MSLVLRASVRRTLIVALLIAALCVGYLGHSASTSSSPRHLGRAIPEKRLTAGDLMLAASTATGFHLRYGTIGNGTATDHTNDVPLQDMQWDSERATTVGGTGVASGKETFGTLSVDHAMDKWSTLLINQHFRGGLAQASLYFTDLSGTGGTALDYLEIDLANTIISKYSMGGASDQRPNESFTFTFAAITFKYKASSTSPLQTVTFNQVTNT